MAAGFVPSRAELGRSTFIAAVEVSGEQFARSPEEAPATGRPLDTRRRTPQTVNNSGADYESRQGVSGSVVSALVFHHHWHWGDRWRCPHNVESVGSNLPPQ
jgi:hypothetical protein